MTKAVDEVRDISEAEVDFYRDHGWVKLEGLVAPTLASAMLERAKARYAAPQTERGGASIFDNKIVSWTEWRCPTRINHEEPFTSAALSKVMGHNVQRLVGRQVPMRIWHDIVIRKTPAGRDDSNKETTWHQDLPNWSIDRPGLTVWIALDTVTPDQALVQYLSGSVREGPLGRLPKPDASGNYPGMLELYPELEKRYQRSPLYTLKPGDAVCHHSLTVHGSGVNVTPRERWSYLVSYFPGDALYTGAPNKDSDGFGIQIGEPFEHPTFAQAYP
jgi:ectoine hydroxylase-related dioxygenase (phytanoyl-CoA dioxygenase family)